MLFSCLMSQYGSECSRRDWTTKRLSSLSLRVAAEETSTLSPPLRLRLTIYGSHAASVVQSKKWYGEVPIIPGVPIKWLNNHRTQGYESISSTSDEVSRNRLLEKVTPPFQKNSTSESINWICNFTDHSNYKITNFKKKEEKFNIWFLFLIFVNV